MNTNSVRNYFIIAALLSLAIGITINFPLVMSYLFGEADGAGRHGERFIVSFTHLGAELIITLKTLLKLLILQGTF